MNKEYLISVIDALCLSDHMGDVSDVIDKIAKDLKIELDWDKGDECLSLMVDDLPEHKSLWEVKLTLPKEV